MISLRARSVCVSPSKTSTPPLPVSRAVPLIQSILFFLNRNSTPLVSPVDDRGPCALHLRPCRSRRQRCPERRWLTPHSLRVLDDLQRVRVLEQRLGRNAAPQQARAAERLLLLDDGDFQPELRGADRGHIAAGAGADHDDVVFVGHGSSRVRRVSLAASTRTGGRSAVVRAGGLRRVGAPRRAAPDRGG